MMIIMMTMIMLIMMKKNKNDEVEGENEKCTVHIPPLENGEEVEKDEEVDDNGLGLRPYRPMSR